jgi:hypothetical protein
LSLSQLTGEGGKNTDDDSKNSGYLPIYSLTDSALLGLVLGSGPKLDPDPESESDPKRVVTVDEGEFLTGYTGLHVRTLDFELFSNRE